MIPPNELKNRIFNQLRMIQDPGTSLNVLRMRIIRSMEVNDKGQVRLVVKPSSNICPLVANLTTTIKAVIEDVDGVAKVHMTVIDHINAGMLNQLLNE